MGPNVLRTPPSSSAAEDKRSRNDQSTDGNVDASSPGLVFRGQQSRGSGGSAQRDGAETRWGRGWEDERTVDRRRRGYGVMAVACFLEHSSGYDSHLVGWKPWGRRGYSGRQRLRREEHGWEERNTVQQHFNTLSTLLFAGPSFGGGARREVIFEVRRGIKERYCLLEEGQ
ncbi:hypothetical protein KC346_g46 [Hortaea werneckii]|nr:hypothetical protein KC346_g46 [Hortaea werneckii]